MPDQQPIADGAAVEASVHSSCWRCGLSVPADVEYCPHCAARQTTVATGWSALTNQRVRTGDSFNLLFFTYAVLLAVGIAHAFVVGLTIQPKKGVHHGRREQLYVQILVVEGIDTVVVVWALLLARRDFLRDKPPARIRMAAWILVLPVLGALLLLNLGYHEALRRVFHIPLISDELMQRFDILAFIAICVQPAVVEEAYCRLFALDCLRGALGRHAAVWISATMFGFLHVAVLPSVPYLIILGAVLAYLRLASGTLLLPILFHFAHNLVILLIECGMR